MVENQSRVYRDSPAIIEAQYDREHSKDFIQSLTIAIAEAEGVDPTDLPPLYHTIDGDILARLFESRGKSAESDVVLSFRIESWHVFVRNDGQIRICDSSRSIDPVPVFA
jgi:hypothetical protein